MNIEVVNVATCSTCKDECKARACCLNEEELAAWCGCGLELRTEALEDAKAKK